MKTAVAVCIAVITLLQSNVTLAWSSQVHTQLGNKVYQLLTKNEREYYDNLAVRLGDGSLQFHNMSAWVDSVRGISVYELFDKNVPQALRVYRSRPTDTWHYENHFYDGSLKMHGTEKKHACRMQNKGNLEQAMLAIDRALSERPDKQQESILIAFAMHLLEDVHQPLHTTSLVRSDCTHDRGGNLYCLNKISGQCIMNLHKLWDQGFSVASNREFMQSIQLAQPPQLPLKTELGLLLIKGQDLAEKAYETEENRIPHAYYFDWAKQASKIQIERSVRRVAYYLKKHYEQSIKK